MVRVTILLMLLGCSREEGEPEETVGPETGLSAAEVLIRTSIDVRGVRPTPDEVASVGDSYDAVDDLIADFLADERWGAQVRDLFGYAYLTRSESYYVLAHQYGLSGAENIGPFTSSMGEEALRMVSTIAEEDLPWTTLVTADWTMANEYLAAVLPVDYPVGETGWEKVRYNDGRPAAGVISNATLWVRYTSTTSNANRGRANALSRMLLCADYLEREIEFDRDVNLLDEEATLNAIQTNPGCTACHNSLDPLGSHLYGFMAVNDEGAIELVNYHAERENWWTYFTGTAPSYFGQPTTDLADLGWMMAGDSRLRSCAVEQVYEGLLQKSSDASDTQNLLTHLSHFENGGLTLRTLYDSVLRSDAYQGVGVFGVQRKMLRPEQYASTVEALTGYRMTYFDYDLLQSDLIGVRTLAGGIDGVSVTTPAAQPSVTTVLVQERIAEGAAWTVVEADQSAVLAGGEPRLFQHIDWTETMESDGETIRLQIADLHRQILNQEPSDAAEDFGLSEQLWEDLFDLTGRTDSAWAGLVSALLRDPEFLYY